MCVCVWFSMSYCRWLRMRRQKWCTQVEGKHYNIKEKEVLQFRINSHMPMLPNRKNRLSVSPLFFEAGICFWSWWALVQNSPNTHTQFGTIRSLFQATWDMEMPIQYLHKINVNEITFRKYQLSAFDTYCVFFCRRCHSTSSEWDSEPRAACVAFLNFLA